MDNTKTEDEIKAAAAAAAEAKAASVEAAKVAKEEKKAADKAAREAVTAGKKAAKLAAAETAKAEKAAKAAAKVAEAEATKNAAAQPEQNGVKRPKAGSKCARVWEICDGISASLSQPAPVDAVLTAAGAEGLHQTTTRCQYAHWKKFNGLTGRITVAVPATEAAATTETAPV